jgi:hypothetical protein
VLGRMTRNIERDNKVPWKILSMPRRMMGALGQGKAPLPKQRRNLGQMGRLEWLLGMFQGFETSLLALGTSCHYIIYNSHHYNVDLKCPLGPWY